MELDDRVMVKLKAGDALVQRGTIHNWVNRGTEDCVIAFVLISAKPVTAAGKPLKLWGSQSDSYDPSAGNTERSIRLDPRSLHGLGGLRDLLAEECGRRGGVAVVGNVAVALHDVRDRRDRSALRIAPLSLSTISSGVLPGAKNMPHEPVGS